MEPTTLQTELTLDPRYRIEEVVDSPGFRREYHGTDLETGAGFCALRLVAAEKSAISKLKEFSHAHVAKVLDVVAQEDGSAILIAERVLGQTFEGYVREHLSKNHQAPVDGVRLVLRLADAVSHAQGIGACHGSIGPRSVIAVPEGRPGPVLGFSGWAECESAFFLGGVRSAGEPTEAGDTWAIGGLLYFVLLGIDPPVSGLNSVKELRGLGLHGLGVFDVPLTDALLTTLNADTDARAQTLKPLKRDLARWFVEHASDESLPPGAHSTLPPPLPSRASPLILTGEARGPDVASPRATLPPAPRSRKGLLVSALGALAVGLIGSWVYSSTRSVEEPVVAPPLPKAEPVETEKAIELSEVPVMGDEQALTSNKAASCVSGYLPKGAFGKPPDLEWLCKERDPRQGAEKLRGAVVQAAVNAPSEVMRVFGRLGWYDMAAFAVVHAGCCAERPPLELPKPSEKCADMARALEELGVTIMSSGDVSRALENYGNSVKCEIAAGRAKEFKHQPSVDGGENSAFRELIKGVTQP